MELIIYKAIIWLCQNKLYFEFLWQLRFERKPGCHFLAPGEMGGGWGGRNGTMMSFKLNFMFSKFSQDGIMEPEKKKAKGEIVCPEVKIKN